MALLPNFDRSLDAPTTATVFGMPRLSLRKDLAGVEDIARVECRLDALHQRDLIRRQLDAEIRRLGEADAVLAADRSFECDDLFEQQALGVLRAGALAAVI